MNYTYHSTTLLVHKLQNACTSASKQNNTSPKQTNNNKKNSCKRHSANQEQHFEQQTACKPSKVHLANISSSAAYEEPVVGRFALDINGVVALNLTKMDSTHGKTKRTENYCTCMYSNNEHHKINQTQATDIKKKKTGQHFGQHPTKALRTFGQALLSLTRKK